MAWPTDAVATGELITAAQLNGLPVRIANTTLGASASSIDFQSIPSHYAHLVLHYYLRYDVATTVAVPLVRFNNDSGGNYDYQILVGNGSGASAGETFAGTSADAGYVVGTSAPSNVFTGVTMLIPHYANSSNNKTAFVAATAKWGTATTTLAVKDVGVFWRSSSAINRVTLLPPSGNFVSGCRATLYGYA